MLDSVFLDVALRLIFAYVLIGLICSPINEFVSQWLALRSGILRKWIEDFLTDPKTSAEFFDHPLIKSLRLRKLSGTLGYPAYLPASTFATALLDLLAAKGGKLGAGDPARADKVEQGVGTLANQELVRTTALLFEASREDNHLGVTK